MTHVLVTGSANCSACSPPRLIDDRGLPATTWSAPTDQGHPCYVDLIVVESASVVLTAGTDAEPLYEYGPGSVIGELVLLTGHGVQFSAQATQPGVVHRVTPMSLRNLLLEERELSELLLTAFMARRRRGRNDRGGRVTLEIVGTPQSPATQALRTYANRTGIKHTWLDADGPSGRSLMSAAGLVGADLPAVVGPRETVINATPADLVTIRDGTPRAGVVDVVVVGAGPAGLAAAVGCALVGMSTVTLDREGPGGRTGHPP
jgi:thioredoxin reductase (NADPH)